MEILRLSFNLLTNFVGDTKLAIFNAEILCLICIKASHIYKRANIYQ